MKVFLIQAKQKSDDRFLVHPPYGLLYLASVLRQSGHTINIYDANIKPLARLELYEEEIYRSIKSFNPDVIGMGGMCSSFKFARKVSSFLKKHFLKIPLIGGGLLISALPETVMRNCTFDAGCIGEAEEIIVELVERMKEAKPLDDIEGLVIRKGSQLVVTGPSDFLKGRRKRKKEGLDWIPFPSYDLIDIKRYALNQGFCGGLLKRHFRRIGSPKKASSGITPYAMPVFAGRGCPFTCTFCFSTMDKKPVKHSVDYVIKHLEFLEKEYGINHFQFLDENFNIDKPWVLEFCRKIIAKGKNYYFTTGNRNRCGFFDKEMLELMKEANFYDISVGVESLDDGILKEMSKGLASQKILETLSLIKSVGVEQEHVRCLFGFPSDSKNSIYGSIKKGNSIGYKTLFAAVIPLPGTELFDYCLSKNIIDDPLRYIEELYDKDGYRNMTQFRDFNQVSSIIKRANVFSELDYCLRHKFYGGFLKALLSFLVIKKIGRLLEMVNLKNKTKQLLRSFRNNVFN